MKIEELHWQVRIQFNKLANNHNLSLTDVEIDNALNQGQEDYINTYFYGSFEANRQKLDMVSTIIKSLEQSSVDKDVVLTKPKDYRSFIRGSVTQGNCKTVIHVERESGIEKVLLDFHRKPSIKFARSIMMEEVDKLKIYNEKEGDKTILIFYLKEPAQMRLGSYKDINNNQLLVKTECELPQQFQNLLVDFSVNYLKRIYGLQEDSRPILSNK